MSDSNCESKTIRANKACFDKLHAKKSCIHKLKSKKIVCKDLKASNIYLNSESIFNTFEPISNVIRTSYNLLDSIIFPPFDKDEIVTIQLLQPVTQVSSTEVLGMKEIVSYHIDLIGTESVAKYQTEVFVAFKTRTEEGEETYLYNLKTNQFDKVDIQDNIPREYLLYNNISDNVNKQDNLDIQLSTYQFTDLEIFSFINVIDVLPGDVIFEPSVVVLLRLETPILPVIDVRNSDCTVKYGKPNRFIFTLVSPENEGLFLISNTCSSDRALMEEPSVTPTPNQINWIYTFHNGVIQNLDQTRNISGTSFSFLCLRDTLVLSEDESISWNIVNRDLNTYSFLTETGAMKRTGGIDTVGVTIEDLDLTDNSFVWLIKPFAGT